MCTPMYAPIPLTYSAPKDGEACPTARTTTHKRTKTHTIAHTQPLPPLDDWAYAGATVLRGQECEIWTLREKLSGAKYAVYSFYITPQGVH